MSEINGLEYFNSLFDNQEKEILMKAQAFDKIATLFFNKNFGTTTKSETELLMFSIFMDAMIDANKNSSGVLDYSACSDYHIGKYLGIPQEKVRTLKIKKQARYPQSFDWRESLKNLRNNIRYDEKKDKIIIPIQDPNLYNEIRNFIEENGGFIEIQRGANCIQIRPEYFFILLYQAVDNESDKKEIRERFAKELREHNEKTNIDSIKTDSELNDAALSYGDDFFELAVSVAEGISNPLVGIIKCVQCLGKIAKRKIKNNN